MPEQKSILNIEDEMRSSFLDYAMSVIIARALPDVRDGLKPVHRRILFAMHQLRNTHAQAYKKSARVVGDVIGKYHPHGDNAVYDALVRLAQTFALRYPLVDGQGNFGSIDGDAPAAMRYTEVRMDRLAAELLADLEKETVNWTPNYDEKELEPSVLPTRVPNLLINGSVGIAVGMATNIPPHHLGEVVAACIAMLDDPELPTATLLELVRGPDFPTGGLILGQAGIRMAYTTGRGTITVRARAEIEEDEKGRESIVVTEIPYQVNKTRLIERIAELVRDKKLEGISDIQDYSDRSGMRIWIQVKREASALIVLNALYKATDLQLSFGANMIAIVGGRPQMLTLRDAIRHFLDHRRVIVTRRCRFDLRKAVERREIVEGLAMAVNMIDRVVALVRAAADPDAAKTALMAEPMAGFAEFLRRCDAPEERIYEVSQAPYRLSERQAKAILEMRLQRLTGMERGKIDSEFRELSAAIRELESVLEDSSRLRQVIREELVAIAAEYEQPRRTDILIDEHEIQPIDLVADESMVVLITQAGYVKRMPTREYRVQARGGVGVKSGSGRDDEDMVVDLFEASAHAVILLFTNTGRVFRKRVFEFPQGSRTTRGKALVNFLELREGERILRMVGYRQDEVDEHHFVVLASREGYVKRTELADFANIRASGLIATTVGEGDALVAAHITNGRSHLLMASATGMAIRFDENEVRPMGRTARGVRGMGLRDGDEVVSMLVLDIASNESLLTLCAHGYGKRTPAADYRAQSRAGLGLITIEVNERNGNVVGMLPVHDDDQLIVVTSRGKIIRTPVTGISELGRRTMGVRVIRMSEGEVVVGLQRLADAADDSNEDPGIESGDSPDQEGGGSDK